LLDGVGSLDRFLEHGVGSLDGSLLSLGVVHAALQQHRGRADSRSEVKAAQSAAKAQSARHHLQHTHAYTHTRTHTRTAGGQYILCCARRDLEAIMASMTSTRMSALSALPTCGQGPLSNDGTAAHMRVRDRERHAGAARERERERERERIGGYFYRQVHL
jgi:hypothetical protein